MNSCVDFVIFCGNVLFCVKTENVIVNNCEIVIV